jgi:hypothetical protein
MHYVCIIFWLPEMVSRVPIPEGRSVTGISYRDSVLSAVVSHYTTARPRTGVRGIKLLHDNAPAHKSVVVKLYLSDNSIETLPHPACSTDLAPCDVWLHQELHERSPFWISGRRRQRPFPVSKHYTERGLPKSIFRLDLALGKVHPSRRGILWRVGLTISVEYYVYD